MNTTLSTVVFLAAFSVTATGCRDDGEAPAAGVDRASAPSVGNPTPIDVSTWADRIAAIHTATVFADVQAHPNQAFNKNLEPSSLLETNRMGVKFR